MKTHSKRWFRSAALALVTVLLGCAAVPALAQAPFVVPNAPTAQRNALNAVRAQINWLQNATRTASNYGQQGYGNVWGTFQGLRQAYQGFKSTLTPQQLAAGANALAELEAGLDILQEAFANCQEDVAAGHAMGAALNNMCRVLRQGTDLWWRELSKTSSRLRVGFG